MGKSNRKGSGSSDDEAGLEAKVQSLKQQVRLLEEEVHRLKLKRDILEATAETLKKTRSPTRRD